MDIRKFYRKFLSEKDGGEKVQPKAKAFSELSLEERKAVLRDGAKNFSRDFTYTIEQLANE